MAQVIGACALYLRRGEGCAASSWLLTVAHYSKHFHRKNIRRNVRNRGLSLASYTQQNGTSVTQSRNQEGSANVPCVFTARAQERGSAAKGIANLDYSGIDAGIVDA